VPIFSYRARLPDGALTEGEMDSASSSAVAGQLMEKGITPLQITEQKQRVDVMAAIVTRLDLHRVSIEELLMFTRQMSALARAGIPITRAIAGIRESIQNPLLIRALQDVLEQLESGRNLSIALARHPRVFSNLYISMIQVGENTGQLDEAFAQMASYIERNRKMSHNISAALRYPTTVIVAIIIAMGIVNLFVIPKFAEFFEANSLQLPWQTVLLLSMSNFFVANWQWMLALAVVLFFIFRHYISTINGRYNWHRFILKVPLVGDILLRAYLARFARSFAMAYGAGVPITLGNDYGAASLTGAGANGLFDRLGIIISFTRPRAEVADINRTIRYIRPFQIRHGKRRLERCNRLPGHIIAGGERNNSPYQYDKYNITRYSFHAYLYCFLYPAGKSAGALISAPSILIPVTSSNTTILRPSGILVVIFIFSITSPFTCQK